ncbi:chromodomain-helicase-DNA-binding protein 1-like [Dorcoceras hygrometricum]|uniref:Chromodomain-helicase-DNA-binding protein 1-like n=1 Tax=Dorcoceras hygrometricum TaxID=472368 RepID=A0A2Z7CGJ7_9LAMI|nr:chromodomain-helicase-DNA-binding protein 1-like [Dorcoceras hygrometricum]
MLGEGEDDAELVVLFKNEKAEEEAGAAEKEALGLVVADPGPVADAEGNENPGEPDALAKENPGAEVELEALVGAVNDVAVEEELNGPNGETGDELNMDEDDPVSPKVDPEFDPDGTFPRKLDEVANENPGAEEAELEALVDNEDDVATEEELNEPNKVAGDELNMGVEEPKRPKVDPELDPNDDVFPIDATFVEDEGVEEANRPPAGNLPSNTGGVVAEEDAAVDEPNTVDPGIGPDPDGGPVVTAFDDDKDDPNRLEDEARPDPNDDVVVLLLDAPEKKPKGLEVEGALLEPDKFEDPGAEDENNVEVPNGDDEGDVIAGSGENMNYEQRLIEGAKFVYAGDARASADAQVDLSELEIKATLKHHQIEGVSWLIRRYHHGVNVILGDEVRFPVMYQMGLGKTLQAISLLSYLKVCQKSPGPFLVLCPLSVTDSWVSEIANFAPKLRLLRYVGEKEHRRKLRWEMYEHIKKHSVAYAVQSWSFDVLLTTYDTALIDRDFLCQFPWHYTIIDEAQRLKNPNSVLYNTLRERFLMPRKLLMTGTPIQNNLSELWALLHFCMASIFGTKEQFLSTFSEAGDPLCYDAEKAKEQFKILKYVLGAFMLRRTKSKLTESGTLLLPPITEITVLVSDCLMAPLVSLQKKVYLSIMRKELPRLLALASRTSTAQSLHNIVIQLRKACSHPYLFPGIEPEPYQEGEHLVQASGKLLILDQLLQKLHDSQHRDYLELRKYTYERLDGSVRAEERFAAIRSFSRKSVDESYSSDTDLNTPFVFLISTRAGGVGLNLVAADSVIFYEQDWNPQVDKQALQRAHRIGQSNHVLSINLVSGHTIEEIIMRRAERKLQLSHNVVGEDYLNHEGNNEGVEAGDLKSLIFGLHNFDPLDINVEKSDELNMDELICLADNVIGSRHELRSNVGDRKFEINPIYFKDSHNLVVQEGSRCLTFDPGLDESSYTSWVEKFKQASQADDSDVMKLRSGRQSSDEKHLKAEASRKKSEEEKLSKWEALGYHSLSVSNPLCPSDLDVISDSGSVHFVYGDCTKTSIACPSQPTIIFSCVDNSGKWGRGGLFDALARVSPSVPNAYEQASKFGDLHLGDLHLIEINGDQHNQSTSTSNTPRWVALAVVQSYNIRRKIPRSNISITDLEVCLAKASSSAAQYSASIHMPRIGYQDSSDRAEWYTVERLLRKHAAMYAINIYVYVSLTLNIVWGVGRLISNVFHIHDTDFPTYICELLLCFYVQIKGVYTN